MNIAEFQELIWEQGRAHYRTMPWRDEPLLYNVLVSEIMLQQTQVSRVLTKYTLFMQAFPTIEALAQAPLSAVLTQWQGLGYNRRAKFLHEAAKYVVANGTPTSIHELVALPGVGKNTAGAIMNYVYETPTAYIETNIRTVYFEHFFSNSTEVSDAQLLASVESTLDQEHPREWFYAIMDYGAYLKSVGSARLTQSKHYKKQPPLVGSVREVRGYILALLSNGPATKADIILARPAFADRLEAAVLGLLADGLVTEAGGKLKLTD